MGIAVAGMREVTGLVANELSGAVCVQRPSWRGLPPL